MDDQVKFERQQDGDQALLAQNAPPALPSRDEFEASHRRAVQDLHAAYNSQGKPAAVDDDALAKKYGAISSTPSGTIDDDALAKQFGAISSTPAEAQQPSTWSNKLGLTSGNEDSATPLGTAKAIARQGVDALEGAASGAASTVFKGGELIRSGLRGLGIHVDKPIDKPAVQQAMRPPDSTAGKLGKFGEQAAEFAGGGEAASALTAGAKLLPRALAQAGAAGGVAALQTGGDKGSVATAAATGAAIPLVGAGLEAGSKAITNSELPRRLYQSALKPTWAMFKNDAGQMIQTGMEEGVPVSSAGLAMTEQKIADLGKQINAGVVQRSQLGRTVDTSKVLRSLDDLENFYLSTPTPEAGLKEIQGIRDQMEAWHGQKMTLAQAQQMKVNTYQLLRDSYGEMKSAKIEGLKAVARGLKEQIETAFPEIADLNQQQSKMLDLNDALYRGLWRIENHQMMGIGSPLAATAGHAIMGGPGAAAGLIGKFVLDDPGLKSKLAIALTRKGTPAPFSAVKAGMEKVKGMIQESLRPADAGIQLPQAAQDQQPAPETAMAGR